MFIINNVTAGDGALALMMLFAESEAWTRLEEMREKP